MVRNLVLVLAVLVSFFPARAQDKPALVVKTFTLASGVNWPYDMAQLQIQTVTELKIKDAAHFDVLVEAPGTGRRIYTLEGEVAEWRAGNKATRLLVGMGSGRETAVIHYWLSDTEGKKVFEHTDTIRQAF